MKYVCDKCSKRVDSEQVKETAYPHWHDQPKMIEWAENLRRDRGEAERSIHRYHTVHEFRCGQTRRWFCGPLHEETEQEAFVHWVETGKF